MDRLDQLLARFEAEYLELNSITPHRRWNQKRVLTLLAESMGDRPLSELTPQDVTTFIGSELAAGLHVNTARQHVGMVRSFVTWASSAGLIDPMRTMQLKSVPNPRGSTSRSTPKPYKMAEIADLKARLADKYPVLPEYGRGSRLLRRFLQGYSPRLHSGLWRHARRLQLEAQIALALEQGLRRVEILRLTVPAMHYDNDEVVVLTAKQGPGSDVLRTVPYTTHARNCVQEWLDFRLLLRPDHDHPWLMLHNGALAYQLQPMTMTQMTKALRSLGGYQWKRLRHTAATEWLRAGVPLEKVSLFMGHSNLEQTRAYTEILNSDVSQAFGRAEDQFAKRLGLAA
jgi:integrase